MSAPQTMHWQVNIYCRKYLNSPGLLCQMDGHADLDDGAKLANAVGCITAHALERLRVEDGMELVEAIGVVIGPPGKVWKDPA